MKKYICYRKDTDTNNKEKKKHKQKEFKYSYADIEFNNGYEESEKYADDEYDEELELMEPPVIHEIERDASNTVYQERAITATILFCVVNILCLFSQVIF